MHRIRRQILDLELPREDGAAQLAQQFGQLFQDKVLPELDKFFDQIAPNGRVLRIQHLEIDLDRFAEKGFEKAFVEKCLNKIREQITAAAFDSHNEAAKAAIEHTTTSADALVAMSHFLSKGTLPWFAKASPLIEIEKHLVDLLRRTPDQVVSVLKPILWTDPQTFRRLIWQFSFECTAEILERSKALPPNSIQKVIRVLQKQVKKPLSKCQKESLLWCIYHSKDLVPIQDDATPIRILKWAAAIGVFEKINLPLSKSLISSQPSTKQTPHTTLVPSANDQLPLSSPSSASIDQVPLKPLDLPGQEARISDINQPIPGRSGDNRQRSRFEVMGEPVDGAGLVLLGPYLKPFFKNLGLLPKPTEPASAYRAIHLLHFLTFGELKPEEPLLIIPKLLCGLAVEEPVPLYLEQDLTEEEKEEGLNLLKAIIANWSALKKTSPDGLRQGFLQREGLLSWQEADRKWQLQIERQGQDLLLERIPWSYSVVKLDWTDWIITVEW